MRGNQEVPNCPLTEPGSLACFALHWAAFHFFIFPFLLFYLSIIFTLPALFAALVPASAGRVRIWDGWGQRMAREGNSNSGAHYAF